MGSKKVVIAGCARDCAEFLPPVLHNVSRLAALFSQSAFVFVENDSSDDTRRVLRDWCAQKLGANLLTLDGLVAQVPQRTIRLEMARNQYLAMLRARYADYDYLLTLDCDNTNTRPIDLDDFARAVAFLEAEPDRAAVFANVEGPYYDLWALRHPTLCPGDVWEEVCDDVIANKVSDEEAFQRNFKRRLFTLRPESPPLEVNSAFGGFGLYKISSVLRNRRGFKGSKVKILPPGFEGVTKDKPEAVGWQCCEHVAFHAGFRENGERLFVLPWLMTNSTIGYQFPTDAWRLMLFYRPAQS